MSSISPLTTAQLAKVIDHSLLRPELTSQDVITGCELAARYHTASVCVKPCHVNLAAEVLAGSDVLVSTVIGFPHGANLTEVKDLEARLALSGGARELDMVMNIGEFRSGHLDYVLSDINTICRTAHGAGAKVKVILENAYVTKEKIVQACQVAEQAGADWVKTSTGFAPSGADLDDLRLMRASVGPGVQVKAAGGVRTLDMLLAVVAVGCTRCGATATAAMLDEHKQRTEGKQ